MSSFFRFLRQFLNCRPPPPPPVSQRQNMSKCYYAHNPKEKKSREHFIHTFHFTFHFHFSLSLSLSLRLTVEHRFMNQKLQNIKKCRLPLRNLNQKNQNLKKKPLPWFLLFLSKKRQFFEIFLESA